MKIFLPTFSLILYHPIFCLMKNTLTFFVLLMPALLAAQVNKSIDYLVKYDFTPVIDTSTAEVDESFEFLLMHADGESRFHSSNKQFNDSMAFAYTSANPQHANPKTQEEMQAAVNDFTAGMRQWRKRNTVNYIIRKNFKENKFQNVLSFAFPKQHLEESMSLEWQIQSEQDSILGLLCYRATTMYGGRKYNAWFAPSIPIPDGPYVFNGLPGLIMQVSDEKDWFTFRIKNISTSPQEIFWKEKYINSRSQAISRKSFVEQSYNQKNNPRITNATNVSEEKLLEMKERYKWRYFMLLECN